MNKKKFLMFGLIGLFALALVTAGLIQYFGQVQRDVTVNPSILVNDVVEYSSVSDSLFIEGGESVVSDDLNVESQTSVNVPLSIQTKTNGYLDVLGVTHTVNYLLDNTEGFCGSGNPTCEKRVFVSGEDAEVLTLNDLNTISWDALVSAGYLPHVDVRLANGETLVFEYAKVNPNNCDNTPYPTGEVNTFDDKEIVDDSAYAWLSSGPAGPCGDSTFDEDHKSLADWKSMWGSVEVIGFDFEVDNWIYVSNSIVSNILINGDSVDVTLKPSDSLVFNVETEFAIDIVPDTYTITTTVDLR